MPRASIIGDVWRGNYRLHRSGPQGTLILAVS